MKLNSQLPTRIFYVYFSFFFKLHLDDLVISKNLFINIGDTSFCKTFKKAYFNIILELIYFYKKWLIQKKIKV